MTMYKNHTIRTFQDSLDDYHAVIADSTGEDLAIVPPISEYGKSTEKEAETQAKRVITRYVNGYQ